MPLKHSGCRRRVHAPQRERVSDGELEGAQDYMVGHFPLTIEVPDAIATQVLNQLFYELPVDELPKYRERVLRVTPDEIQRVARWFIRPSQLSIVLVGDADKFVNDLKGVGFGTFERIPIDRVDLMSPDLTKRQAATRPSDAPPLSCGEASGDLYAGRAGRGAAPPQPDIDVFGLGGERFAAAGGRLIADFHGMSVTGLAEALSVVPRSFATLRKLTKAARQYKPHALVVIDYPDFNFRLMRFIKKQGIPVVYYISPQLWAWRPGRIKLMKRSVDRVLPIFPFEEDLYKQHRIDVRFVGHPLIDLAKPRLTRDVFLKKLNLDPGKPVLALLPGSRKNELERLAPVIAKAVPAIAARVPGLQFVVARAPNLNDGLFEPFGLSGVTGSPTCKQTMC
jgi:hypothetical protein